MTVIQRSLMAELIDWKGYKNRSPLTLRGARQVGKTYLVKYFAEQHFENLAYLNFKLQPRLSECFANLDPQQIVNALRLVLDTEITPGKTLLFIDEIQECPDAIMALRYFKELMPELHVISAGSLLKFALNDKNFSMPVGRVEYMYIKPLSFLEFLQALGKQRRVISVCTKYTTQ